MKKIFCVVQIFLFMMSSLSATGWAQTRTGGEWKASFADVVKENQDSVVQLVVEVSKYEKVYHDFKEPGTKKQPVLGRVLNFFVSSVWLVACVLPCTALDHTLGLLCRGGEPVPKLKSEGTGFVVFPEGYVLTNYHVVRLADRVVVTLRDGTKREGEVVGYEKDTDLAMVKLKLPEGESLPAVKITDMDGVEVGDLVIAIGNPFGLTQSVTTGVVSSLRRQGPYIDYLQTDAALNPGNSGGPLFLSNGDVIGVNTAIFAAGQNLGFAIPSDVVLGVLDSLKDGAVQRGTLGVSIRESRESGENGHVPEPESGKKEAIGQKITGKETGPVEKKEGNEERPRDAEGLEVVYVEPEGPAAKAGVKVKDVILEVDGKVMDKMSFLKKVASLPKGSLLPLKLQRGDGTMTVQVTVENLQRRTTGPMAR